MITRRTKPSSARQVLTPRVQRVVEELTRRINQGRLHAGDQLPTLRELGHAFDVSYGVIHAAFQQLEKDGLISKVQGSGTYVKHRQARPHSRRASHDVYVLMHGTRPQFSAALDAILLAIQDSGLIPIPIAFDRFQRERVERLIGLWHEAPPRAVLVKGASREVAEMVQKHAPAATRFIMIYHMADGTTPHGHSVCPDEFSAHRLAAKYLIDQGHRRIGLPVSVFEDEKGNRLVPVVAKAGGIRQAFVDAGLPDGLVLYEKLVPHTDASAMGLTTETVLRMAEWLSGPQRPTALIENTYRMPCVELAAREAGLRIGEDLAIVGVGDTAPAAHGEYPCVSEQYDEIARQIVAMILSDDDDFDAVGRQVVVPPRFVPQWQPARSKTPEVVAS